MSEAKHFFSDEQLKDLPNEPLDAVRFMIDKIYDFYKNKKSNGTYNTRAKAYCIDGCATVRAYASETIHDDIIFELIEKLDPTAAGFLDRLSALDEQITHELLNKHVVSSADNAISRVREHVLGRGGFSIDDDDIRRAQGLINEIRELIQCSADFPDDHRRRLLARLEKLQAELNNRMSSLDNALGTVIAVATAAGLAADRAKPIVERCRELADIFSDVIRVSFGLPPGQRIKLLDSPSAKEVEPEASPTADPDE